MPHSKRCEEVLAGLGTSTEGLSRAQATQRLAQYGPNEIREEKKISALQIFISQFRNVVVWILIVATAISTVLGEYVDSVVIAVILVLIAVLGFIQEYRAEKAIDALKRLASLRATVKRDGRKADVDARELVPGDLMVLASGDKVAADARVIGSFNLETQEAALTGESLPVEKIAEPLPEKTILPERRNMVFSGTIVTSGRGEAVVTGTGMGTEIGRIATLIQEVQHEATPLQQKLDQLGKWLGIVTLIIAAVVFAVGVLEGGDVLEFLIVAVSLAVAAVPEGLPAVVTISLAIGTTRMLRRHVLVRKLPSVETLGSTTVICTDKTGTLTVNQMTVRKVYVDGQVVEVTGSGYEPRGDFRSQGQPVAGAGLELLLRIGALNNDAELRSGKVMGDPTEGALLVSAAKAGLLQDDLVFKYPRVEEIGFSSERKMMTTLHQVEGGLVAYAKGAPEVLIGRCARIRTGDQVRPLTAVDREQILATNVTLARQALRVLAFAYKPDPGERPEEDLVFAGLQGMIDPPREEVKEAVARCRSAGIRTVMITGDHEITAQAVASEIGIEGRSLTGAELQEMPELDAVVEEVAIYARVNPEHKIKIVEALQKRGHIVAMTGDGVNDAPALKKANIGVAMGLTGTDVAKEASAMILTDDNFASIVNAVEEGRAIYDNIKKYVYYLLSSNLGEVLTIFVAMILGMPLPVLAIMILWINLVTDGAPALALSVDPPDPHLMDRRPRPPQERIITGSMQVQMILGGTLMMVGTLLVFAAYHPDTDLPRAQTMAFNTLMMFQMFNVLNSRSERSSVFRVGVFRNRWLVLAIASSILLQLAVIYTPLSRFFKTVPVSAQDWLVVVLVSSSILVAMEIFKVVAARLERSR
jgi:Ca2+-transporting ATPase